MAPTLCAICQASRALIIRPKNHQKLCKSCFIAIFEAEIHHTITTTSLFSPGDKIAIGASGGKDSTVLASVLKTLNERHSYGLELVLLSIDEGIKGYRDDSRNGQEKCYTIDMPLKIVGYDELYGWTMDQVVEVIGKKGNYDVAETILMNLLRGDLPRLARSTSIITGDESSEVRRSKPLKYAYEKKSFSMPTTRARLFYHECLYSPEAFRGSARSLIKNLERVRPSAILDVVRSGEDMAKLVPEEVTGISHCKTQKVSLSTADDEGATGCGTSGRSGGGEMADMERRLRANEDAAEREIDMSNLVSNSTNGQQGEKKGQKSEIKKPKVPGKKLTRQTLGTCRNCGYMSSQEICKACTLLDGLNKIGRK
ncbi:hypothetical protein B0O99DRAFT_681962 [Bisporella sp. PMI_857]|nr:hypothetical protein B0O99DRAFT_681962 [Bisporella sp. PMI_857]